MIINYIYLIDGENLFLHQVILLLDGVGTQDGVYVWKILVGNKKNNVSKEEYIEHVVLLR